MCDLTDLPKTRKEAREAGSKFYFTGEPCKRGHVDKRLTRCWTCYACHRLLNNHYGRERYRNDPEADAQKTREWRETNPAKVAARNAKRRALRLNQTPPDADLEAIDAIYDEAAELSEAFGIEYHVDHIVPLAAGGLHHEDNLQILTADENLSKGARTDWVPAPPVFRKCTKHLACGLVAVWHEGVFQGVTTNL